MRTKKFLSLLLSAAMALSLLTATAFAAAPAEEENGFFDFLLGKKYTYLYAALTWDEYWANESMLPAALPLLRSWTATRSTTLAHLTPFPALPPTMVCTAAASRALLSSTPRTAAPTPFPTGRTMARPSIWPMALP